MIFRFHSAWLAVDSFISAAKLRGGGGGQRRTLPPPAPVKPDTFKSVGGFAFFRLSCFDHSDLQLFPLFIFDVDFLKTSLKTSAENSVSEPPNLKLFSPRPLYMVRVFSTRDNVLPLQKLTIVATALIQVCRGGRVIRILCTSIKTLRKCLVKVILSKKTDFGLKEGRF